MTDRETMLMALDALDSKHDMTKSEWRMLQRRAFTALRAALAEQHAAPVLTDDQIGVWIEALRNYPEHDELLRFARAILAAAIPPGYCVVPVEPTREMQEAGWVVYSANLSRKYLRATYAAMIAARPGGETVSELEELKLAYAECSRQKNELLTKHKHLSAEVEALRKQLAEQPVAWTGCGECDYMFKCHDGKATCVRLPEQPAEVPCKTDPRAPHGFVRNASHSLQRYVCECEGWEPDEPVEPVLTGEDLRNIARSLPPADCDRLTAEWRSVSMFARAILAATIPPGCVVVKDEPVAWVEVVNTYEGPYNFHGKELLTVGKHDLYAKAIAARPGGEG